MSSCINPFLPEIKFDLCAPLQRGDQIRYFLFTILGKGFAAEPTATDWNDRVSNSEPLPITANAPNSDYPIRFAHVIGSKGATETSERQGSLGRVYNDQGYTTLEMETEDISNESYELHRQIQDKGGIQVIAWYFTDDYRYGSKNGVKGSLSSEFILSGDDKKKASLKLKFKFKGGDPASSPIPTGINFIDYED